ncbi:MAG: GAF domain-containing protein [Oscillochloris sp.]|nr:GAF domain-containing protein [Oscillochloris sp.]
MTVAQAADRAELQERGEHALSVIASDAAGRLCWYDQATELPAADILRELAAGTTIAGDNNRPGYLPIRVSEGLLGWIALEPGGWSIEQELALQMLASILGPAYRALPLEPRVIRELRAAVLADLALTRASLSVDAVLDRIGAVVQRIAPECSIGIVLQYRNSEWLELAYQNNDRGKFTPRSFWNRKLGLSSVVIDEGRTLTVQNYEQECERRNVIPIVNEPSPRGGAWIGVPLQSEGRTFGAIAVNRLDTDSSFSPIQEELIRLVGTEGAVPLQQALRYRDAEQQARQLTVLNRIIRTINSTLDPERVPELIIEQAGHLLDAEEGTLLLRDTATGELVFSYASGPAGRALLGQRLPPGKGIAGYVAESGRSAISNDTRSDGRFSSEADGSTGFTTQSLIAVPLRGLDGVKGVIEVVNRRDNAPFIDDDSVLLETLADQALIALENARRFADIDDALKHRAQELVRSNSQLHRILRLSHALRAERRLDELLGLVATAVVESAGFRNAAIALVYRERTVEPYLQHAVASGPAAMAQSILRNRRSALSGLLQALQPEFRRGNLTFLIDREQAARFPVLQELVADSDPGTDATDQPGEWLRGDILISLLHDGDGRLLGVLRVDDPEDGRRPDGERVQILEIFANQAATAIESARLYNQQQHNLQSMMALNGLGMAINTTLRSPRQIFELTAAGLLEITSANWAVVLRDQDGDLNTAFQTLDTPADRAAIHQLVRQAISSRRPASDRRSDDSGTWVAMPLRATRSTLGAICVGYSEGQPPATDLEMLSLFGNQAAVAVESLELLAAVRRGRDELASIMASTNDGILLVDTHGVTVVANNAFHRLSNAGAWKTPAATPLELNGLLLSELLESWQISAVFSSNELEQLHHGINAVADGLEPDASGELNGGRSFSWTVLRAARQANDGDTRWPILLTLRDISAAKEAEQLRQDLTNMIIHDLRSPLTSIMTSIDMFFRGVTGEMSPIQKEILSIAYTSTQYLLNMINMLLDISRLESGRMPLDRAALDADDLVRRAIERQQLIARNNGVQVRHEVLAQVQLVHADGQLVLRVLQNLLDNALKFSRRGGEVLIRVEEAIIGAADRPYIRFAVRDNGVGMKQQDLEKIFQKFGQAGDRRNAGTGLGLTFCKLVVEAHDGAIWVESEQGNGSTFFFTLPAAP